MLNHLAESNKTIFDSLDHANPWIQMGAGVGLVFAAFIINLIAKKDKGDASNMGCLVFIIGASGLAVVFHALGILG